MLQEVYRSYLNSVLLMSYYTIMKALISRIILIALMQCCAGTLLAHVELDNPLGGKTFTVGQTVTIEWHIAIPHNTLNWDVLFSSDGGATWASIQMDLPVGSLSYSWVVPNIITSQARVSVIQDNSGQDYQDERMNFTIQAPPMLPFIVMGAMMRYSRGLTIMVERRPPVFAEN